MNLEVFNLKQLAAYLNRDARELERLASRGKLPGRKVGGEWKFSRAEITHWLETQIPDYGEEELANIEGEPNAAESDSVIGELLQIECMAVPLKARTKTSVLNELVRLAEKSYHVYDSEALHAALKQREEILTTALENGVALPHPRRPLPKALGESLIAYGRTTAGIPFGAARGELTDIFFLICCRDDRTHLRALARLSRLLLRPGFLDELRAAEDVKDSYSLLESAERELLEAAG